ncbi:methylglyoxal synthase [Arhodomonas sp. AD133]|uniref:methylglyoxal synthase n=1 Tax=Arhodomonas sp. AD133 TaxID=3415009 RepID=UPI003EB7C9C4
MGQQSTTVRERILLLASRSLRRGPSAPLLRFVRHFEPYFTGILRPELHVLGGSARALHGAGLLRDYPHLHEAPAGRDGGLVALANLLVEGAQDPGVATRVVYLLDPADAASMYPDSHALKRECVVTGTPFLATYEAAAQWYALQWAEAVREGTGGGEWFVDGDTRRRAGVPGRAPGELGIALIAHDALKGRMLAFAEDHFDWLRRFGRRYATGTTGGLLNGKVAPRLAEAWEADRDELAAFERLGAVPPRLRARVDDGTRLEEAAARMAERLSGESWVHGEQSGPKGGDIQVAEHVRRDECHLVAFFEDPHVSREHEADIQLLERATRIPGRAAVCLHDPETVDLWAQRWARTADPQDGAAPMTLAEACARRWGVDLIATDEAEALPKAVADYLTALVMHGAAECPGATQRILIGGGQWCTRISRAVRASLGGADANAMAVDVTPVDDGADADRALAAAAELARHFSGRLWPRPCGAVSYVAAVLDGGESWPEPAVLYPQLRAVHAQGAAIVIADDDADAGQVRAALDSGLVGVLAAPRETVRRLLVTGH